MEPELSGSIARGELRRGKGCYKREFISAPCPVKRLILDRHQVAALRSDADPPLWFVHFADYVGWAGPHDGLDPLLRNREGEDLCYGIIGPAKLPAKRRQKRNMQQTFV